MRKSAGNRRLDGRKNQMTWIKTWIKPVVLVIVWITVLSYTVSMVATVEPTLRRLGQMTEHADPRL